MMMCEKVRGTIFCFAPLKVPSADVANFVFMSTFLDTMLHVEYRFEYQTIVTRIFDLQGRIYYRDPLWLTYDPKHLYFFQQGLGCLSVRQYIDNIHSEGLSHQGSNTKKNFSGYFLW